MGKKIVVAFANTLQTNRNFQYTNIYSCHPPGVKKGFIQREALRLLRTYSSQTTFEKSIQKFRKSPIESGYPAAIVRKYLSAAEELLQGQEIKKAFILRCKIYSAVEKGRGKCRNVFTHDPAKLQ